MLSILRLNIIHLLRLYIPNNLLRNTCIGVIFFLLLLGIAVGVVLGVHPPPSWKGGFRSREFLNNLGGLIALINNSILIIPTFLTINGGLKLMEKPKLTLLVMIAPISPVSKFWASIGPLIFFTAISFLIFTGPFIIMFLFLDPLISAALILYFVILSGWCVTLCLASLVALVHLFGKAKAVRLSYLIPVLLLILPTTLVIGAENFRKIGPMIGSWQLIFLSVSLVILPVCFKYICTLFFALINFRIDKATEYSEPQWGSYSPWRYIRRNAAVLAMVPFLILIILMTFKLIKFEMVNEAIFGAGVYFFATLPVSILMAEEKNAYNRWLLAPHASQIKISIWLKVNLPLFILGAIALFCISGAGHLKWSVTILLFLLLGMIVLTSHKMYKYNNLRGVFYFLIMTGCMAAELVW